MLFPLCSPSFAISRTSRTPPICDGAATPGHLQPNHVYILLNSLSCAAVIKIEKKLGGGTCLQLQLRAMKRCVESLLKPERRGSVVRVPPVLHVTLLADWNSVQVVKHRECVCAERTVWQEQLSCAVWVDSFCLREAVPV